MSRFCFCLNQKLRIASSDHIIVRKADNSKWELKDVATGGLSLVAEVELLRMYYDEELSFVPGESGTTRPTPSRPLQVVDIAEKVIEGVIVVDDWTKIPLNKPKISTAVHRNTGAVLGVKTGVGDLVLETLRDSILPKSHLSTEYATLKNNWDWYGLSDVVVVTNEDRNSPKLVRAGKRLEFRLEPHFPGIPFRHATGDSILELFNRTLLYGGITSILRSQLRELATTFLVDLWMQTPGDAGLSPAQWWSNAMAEYAPALPVSATKLNVSFRTIATCKLRRSGIHLHNGLLYSNDRLIAFFRRSTSKESIVKVAFDREDLGFIHVFDPEAAEYFRVWAVDKNYANGLPLWKHILITSCTGGRYVRGTDVASLGDKVREDLLRMARAEVARRRERDVDAFYRVIKKKHGVN